MPECWRIGEETVSPAGNRIVLHLGSQPDSVWLIKAPAPIARSCVDGEGPKHGPLLGSDDKHDWKMSSARSRIREGAFAISEGRSGQSPQFCDSQVMFRILDDAGFRAGLEPFDRVFGAPL